MNYILWSDFTFKKYKYYARNIIKLRLRGVNLQFVAKDNINVSQPVLFVPNNASNGDIRFRQAVNI